jgi:glutathione S-transferase
MKLYYMGAACSQASNIALRDAGLTFELVKVDRHTRKTADGLDFRDVNPKGYVPALRLDSGEVLTENVAVLQYIADRNPGAKLAPVAGTLERYRLMEWLSYINSELHKGYSPLFKHDVPPEMKSYVREHLMARIDYVESALGERTFLMGEQYTIADPYLFVVLSWSPHVNIDLARWPQLKRYVERMRERPNVQAALKAEGLVK